MLDGCRSAVLASLLAGVLPGDRLAPGQDPLPSAARQSVDRALAWLTAAQNSDGSWGDNPGAPGEIGNTCIATLALLNTGDTPSRGKYGRRIRRALEWVTRRARGYGVDNTVLDTATLLQRKLGQNIDLYLVALLYSQTLGMTVDAAETDRMQAELRQMVDRIAALQQPNGAWETSYEPMLTTISAWLALRQAHAAGVAVHHASAEKVVRYLETECLERETGIFREERWGNRMRFVTQAGALRVLYGMARGRTPEAQLATQVLVRMQFDQDVGGRQGGEEFLGALFATQALHIERDDNYARWYDKTVKALARCQNADGSWVGHHCITGRVFCTACSIMAMSTPNKLLPMIER